MRYVLLLNMTEEVLNFVSEKKALKLLYKEKVEVISSWLDETLEFFGKKIFMPAVLKLRYFVHRKFSSNLIFSRRAVLKRDQYQCQYCSKILKPGLITVDHIVPRSMGGKSTFTNCVAACHQCNKRKGNKRLEDTNLKLLKMPIVPSGYIYFIPDNGQWHSQWWNFLFPGNSNKIATQTNPMKGGEIHNGI